MQKYGEGFSISDRIAGLSDKDLSEDYYSIFCGVTWTMDDTEEEDEEESEEENEDVEEEEVRMLRYELQFVIVSHNFLAHPGFC